MSSDPENENLQSSMMERDFNWVDFNLGTIDPAVFNSSSDIQSSIPVPIPQPERVPVPTTPNAQSELIQDDCLIPAQELSPSNQPSMPFRPLDPPTATWDQLSAGVAASSLDTQPGQALASSQQQNQQEAENNDSNDDHEKNDNQKQNSAAVPTPGSTEQQTPSSSPIFQPPPSSFPATGYPQFGGGLSWSNNLDSMAWNQNHDTWARTQLCPWEHELNQPQSTGSLGLPPTTAPVAQNPGLLEGSTSANNDSNNTGTGNGTPAPATTAPKPTPTRTRATRGRPPGSTAARRASLARAQQREAEAREALARVTASPSSQTRHFSPVPPELQLPGQQMSPGRRMLPEMLPGQQIPGQHMPGQQIQGVIPAGNQIPQQNNGFGSPAQQYTPDGSPYGTSSVTMMGSPHGLEAPHAQGPGPRQGQLGQGQRQVGQGQRGQVHIYEGEMGQGQMRQGQVGQQYTAQGQAPSRQAHGIFSTHQGTPNNGVIHTASPAPEQLLSYVSAPPFQSVPAYVQPSQQITRPRGFVPDFDQVDLTPSQLEAFRRAMRERHIRNQQQIQLRQQEQMQQMQQQQMQQQQMQLQQQQAYQQWHFQHQDQHQNLHLQPQQHQLYRQQLLQQHPQQHPQQQHPQQQHPQQQHPQQQYPQTHPQSGLHPQSQAAYWNPMYGVPQPQHFPHPNAQQQQQHAVSVPEAANMPLLNGNGQFSPRHQFPAQTNGQHVDYDVGAPANTLPAGTNVGPDLTPAPANRRVTRAATGGGKANGNRKRKAPDE